jgi:hypothetical protein
VGLAATRAIGVAVSSAVLLGGGADAGAGRVSGGARAGLRATTLTGQICEDWALFPAVAGILSFELSDELAAGVEPGFAWSGSGKYHLTYVDLPVLAHARYRPDEAIRLRASLGGGPAIRVAATQVQEDDDGQPISEDVSDNVRRIDFDLVAAAAVEWRPAGGPWLFGEIRYGRGLTTVDRQEPGLFIVRQEIGLWIGGFLP